LITRRVVSSFIRARPSAVSDFIAHLEQLDRLYGPQPGRPIKPVVLVEDNGPIHVSKAALAALDARKHWLTVEWLPKYAPELNDIEVVWHDLKAHHLAHKTLTDVAALGQDIHAAVEALNKERNVDPWSTEESLLSCHSSGCKSRQQRCYGASGDEIASIGRLLTERWHPSALIKQPMEPPRWTSRSSTSR
jgi:transposase